MLRLEWARGLKALWLARKLSLEKLHICEFAIWEHTLGTWPLGKISLESNLTAGVCIVGLALCRQGF